MGPLASELLARYAAVQRLAAGLGRIRAAHSRITGCAPPLTVGLFGVRVVGVMWGGVGWSAGFRNAGLGTAVVAAAGSRRSQGCALLPIHQCSTPRPLCRLHHFPLHPLTQRTRTLAQSQLLDPQTLSQLGRLSGQELAALRGRVAAEQRVLALQPGPEQVARAVAAARAAGAVSVA